jgi:hypothetical protein
MAQDALRLLLRLLAHVGDDRGALLPGILPDAGGLVLRVGELVLVLLLGPTSVVLGLVQVGELLADRLLPRRHRPVDRRDDVPGQDEHHDREGHQLDPERSVRDEEVVGRHRDRRTHRACHH